MAKKQETKLDWREERRFRAWDLHQQGWKQRDIATALGVTDGAVSQWLSRARAGGVEDLHNRPRLGASPRLTEKQRQRIPALLARGAEHYGFLGDLWTSQRVAEVIERTFGVRYNVSHVRRLLYALGFSAQKPEVKATQRDEQAIATWVHTELPAIKKKAIDEGRALVYVDESGFYLLPAVARTWAPSGCTPVLRSKLTRDHLSVISGITADGELLMQIYEHSISSRECVRFLKHLVRHLGKVLVVWDGAPIHRSKVVKEYLSNEGKGQVHLERFPAYAPEVNPDEGIWRYLKHVELRNICCGTIDALRYELRCATKRLRNKPEVLFGCFRHALPFSYQ